MAPHLTTRAIGRQWRWLAACGSTNDVASAWARAGAPHGAVVVADQQTGGRGRFARVWHSPPGENLYLSVVLRPPLAPPAAPPLTLAAAVAVVEVARAWGAAPELKWPNDVLLEGRKLCGILTELTTAPAERTIEYVIVGIGINLNTRAFPAGLAGRATSLALALGYPSPRSIARAPVAAALCGRLERWHDRLVAEGPAPIVAAWRGAARCFGRPLTIDRGRSRVSGIAEDIDDTGRLLLRLADGRVERIASGEVATE